MSQKPLRLRGIKLDVCVDKSIESELTNETLKNRQGYKEKNKKKKEKIKQLKSHHPAQRIVYHAAPVFWTKPVRLASKKNIATWIIPRQCINPIQS